MQSDILCSVYALPHSKTNHFCLGWCRAGLRKTSWCKCFDQVSQFVISGTAFRTCLQKAKCTRAQTSTTHFVSFAKSKLLTFSFHFIFYKANSIDHSGSMGRDGRRLAALDSGASHKADTSSSLVNTPSWFASSCSNSSPLDSLPNQRI